MIPEILLLVAGTKLAAEATLKPAAATSPNAAPETPPILKSNVCRVIPAQNNVVIAGRISAPDKNTSDTNFQALVDPADQGSAPGVAKVKILNRQGLPNYPACRQLSGGVQMLLANHTDTPAATVNDPHSAPAAPSLEYKAPITIPGIQLYVNDARQAVTKYIAQRTTWGDTNLAA